jgi:PAS domain S-box-containing protein
MQQAPGTTPPPRSWRVDLHCHSFFSDGTLAPEQLAEELAAAGVGHAALTDHNTTEGLERFREALERRGVRTVSGLELDARASCGPVHLLAYGFDEHDPGLRRALRGLRHPHWSRLGFLRGSGKSPDAPPVEALAPGRGLLAARDAIRLVKQAGGRVFLAHPLSAASGSRLEELVVELKGLGLDGIEAHYKPYDRETRAILVELATRERLLACGGSDYHGPASALGGAVPGIDLSAEDWRPLARALGFDGDGGAGRGSGAGPPRQLRNFLLQIGLPALLAGLLFVLTIFLVLLPAMEHQLLERKREMIRELTRTAASILQEYSDEAEAGLIGPDEARAEAAARVGRLRYGEEGKDYFWITDTLPRMVMHPWLPELDGQDLRGFRDPAGARVFVAFVEAVRRQDSGYVGYYWQWKDDPERIAPKLSYIQAFRPWGWVIGTGIYTEDVSAEVARVKDRLILLCLGISAVVALLLLQVARQSYRIEVRRARAEAGLRESSEKYRALVGAATEGTLLVLDGACAFANEPLERMLGYGPDELAGRPVLGLLADQSTADRAARARLEKLLAGEEEVERFEARLLRREGRAVETLLSPTPIQVAGRDGLILVARDLGRSRRLAEALERSRVHYRKLTRAIRMGVFRSRWQDGRAPLLEANPAMRELLGLAPEADPAGLDWLARIVDEELRRQVERSLESEESVEIEGLALRRGDGSRVEVRLFAVLVREEDGPLCDGVIEDITARSRDEAEREALIAQLQTSLFYLQEPLGPAVEPAPSLDVADAIAEAARRLGSTGTGALVVLAGGEPAGIVTDRDFRQRVTAAGLDPQRPLREIMSAPLATIPEQALVYEAILAMQERRIGHLAVVDAAGRLKGLVRDRNLIHFRHYSSVILAHSLRQAGSAIELREVVGRLPRLVLALLDSGARVRAINRIVSRVADETSARLLALAHGELGPAPCAYAFVAMGSEGRGEQTLLTDQDNGLIYEDPPAGREQAWADWFLAFGQRVSAGLEQAGYRACRGGVMASNPRWNRSLGGWTQQFSGWIREADAQQLLDCNIAFDLRCVGGEATLAHELRRRVFEAIEAHPPFLLHLARNALLGKPPLGMRGQILVQAGADGGRGLDLKEALLPLVNIGRLYALRHRLDETHSLERFGRLHELGRLSQESWDELLPDYEAAMRLRLDRQARALLGGREPTNRIAPGEWTALEEAMLKRLFALSGDLRKKVSFDFLGMA